MYMYPSFIPIQHIIAQRPECGLVLRFLDVLDGLHGVLTVIGGQFFGLVQTFGLANQ